MTMVGERCKHNTLGYCEDCELDRLRAELGRVSEERVVLRVRAIKAEARLNRVLTAAEDVLAVMTDPEGTFYFKKSVDWSDGDMSVLVDFVRVISQGGVNKVFLDNSVRVGIRKE